MLAVCIPDSNAGDKAGDSGISLSISMGKQQQSQTQTTAAASTVGSTAGNVTINDGQTYTQTGSNVLTPGLNSPFGSGNIDISAKTVSINEARETGSQASEQKFKQSGLTVAVTSPVLSAMQTIGNQLQAAGNIGNGRMQALAAANVAMNANNAINAVQDAQGIDQNKNTFTSAGGTTTQDLQNSTSYSAQSVSVGLGTGTPSPGASLSAGLSGVGIGSDKDSASSTTTAGISGVAGNQQARAGDASTSLKPIFDADKVKKEIDAQVKITQEFNKQAGQAITDYAASQRKALQEQAQKACTPEEKAKAEQAIKDVNMQERALNILVSGLTGMAGATVTKEALSTAAEKMRDLMIEDSKKFAGVVDSTGKVLSNVSGPSDGVRGDGYKIGGTRVDLDLLCGPDNGRCTFTKNADGSIDKSQPVQFKGNLEEFLKTPEGLKMAGDTGGVQGAKGTLFGFEYKAGSWQDKLIESFAGSHDMIGGKLTGLYDSQGNIRRGMSDTERAVYDKVVTTGAIPLAAPFAAAEGISPEIWKAIGILLGAGR